MPRRFYIPPPERNFWLTLPGGAIVVLTAGAIAGLLVGGVFFYVQMLEAL